MRCVNLSPYLRAIYAYRFLDRTSRERLLEERLQPPETHLLTWLRRGGELSLTFCTEGELCLQVEIRGVRVHLSSPGDRNFADRYLLALLNLCETGLAEHRGGSSFALSQTGRALSLGSG